MNADEMRDALDELIVNGGHVARTEAADVKRDVARALDHAAEVLIRHELMDAGDALDVRRQWSA